MGRGFAEVEARAKELEARAAALAEAAESKNKPRKTKNKRKGSVATNAMGFAAKKEPPLEPTSGTAARDTRSAC